MTITFCGTYFFLAWLFAKIYFCFEVQSSVDKILKYGQCDVSSLIIKAMWWTPWDGEYIISWTRGMYKILCFIAEFEISIAFWVFVLYFTFKFMVEKMNKLTSLHPVLILMVTRLLPDQNLQTRSIGVRCHLNFLYF